MCEALAIRVPVGLEDLPRGALPMRPTYCESDGSFVITGLIDGDWEVYVGDVALPGGIELRGKIVDGLTGQGMPGARVVAIRRGITLTVKGADGVEEDVPLEW